MKRNLNKQERILNYDVDYFIKKFEAIPEELFFEGRFIEGDKKCSAGHCGTNDENFNNDELPLETHALTSLLKPFKVECDYYRSDVMKTIAVINDGSHPNYQQPTPKQRILAALYDIKRMQEPKQPEVIYKVVEVDRKVKELVKEERILN